MKTTFSSAFALLVLGAHIVPTLAMPAWAPPPIPRALPDGTHQLAVDEVTGEIIAFDGEGTQLDRIPAGNNTSSPKHDARGDPVGACTALSKDDIQKRKHALFD